MAEAVKPIENVNASELPPMLRQYLDYKESNAGRLLLFQVGDFYEAFFEDARTIARELNLTLTSRDKNNPNPIPMCGVPVAVVDGYVDRLVDLGFSVALVTQIGNGTTSKGGVARELERIVTPGVRLLGGASSDRELSIILSIGIDSVGEAAFAFTSPESGEVHVQEGFSLTDLGPEIRRVGALELLVPRQVGTRRIDRRQQWVRELELSTPNRSVHFRSPRARADGRELQSVPGFSVLGSAGKEAVRQLLEYLDEVTVSNRIRVERITGAGSGGRVAIDATTRRNLEITRNLRDGTRRHTLLEVLDRAATAGGARLIQQWLMHPLSDLAELQARQDLVQACFDSNEARTEISKALRRVADQERIAARWELGVVGPPELGAVRDLLVDLPRICSLVESLGKSSAGAKAELDRILDTFNVPPLLAESLRNALAEQPAAQFGAGEVIRAGFDPELDRLRQVRKQGRSWIAEMEQAERSATGISSLKIKYNGVLGYFIEVTKANLSKVPPHYQQKQSMVNAARFVTDQLKEKERELQTAESRELEVERRHFDKLRRELELFTRDIRKLGKGLSEIDALVCLAQVSFEEGWVPPKLESSRCLEIVKGQHPVLAKILREEFVPNSSTLNERSGLCAIVTGPNMGGKSTYLRQVALITLLAQIGCFVPAERARIGLVDRIFARLGAADDLAQGDSTFMVEMREAAYILSRATERSLVLIDELGRGTATTDGLALAQAVLEWMVCDIQARTLFATHFHSLTRLASHYPMIQNLHVGSFEEGGQVVFTHEIREGPASRSYGLQVAKLAGVPNELLRRANEILGSVKEQDALPPLETQQLSFFGSAKAGHDPKSEKRLERLDDLLQQVELIDVNELTPLEGLVALEQLCSKLRKIDSEETDQK